MKVCYLPFQDESILQIHPVVGQSKKEFNNFELWWDEEGNICAIVIKKYNEELREFEKNLRVIQLGGMKTQVEFGVYDMGKIKGTLRRTEIYEDR